MQKNIALAVLCIVTLSLAACCCVSTGINPPQPNQYEVITPPISDTVNQ